MGKPIKRALAYLKSIPADSYNIPSQVAGVVNYFLDSFFAKRAVEEARMKSLNGTIPADPKTHIKEAWLGCEIHKAVSLNRMYPTFAKANNAWAFSKMFDNGKYKIVPFLDEYEWKNAVKESYEYRIQQESIQIGNGLSATLPIFGTYFVIGETRTKLLIRVDFCNELNPYTVTVMSAPEAQREAEKFLVDLDRSIEQNDIYFGKCLSFTRGFLGFEDIKPSDWKEIVLKPGIIQEIRDNSIGVIENMDKLSKLGMIPSRNMILISPPGMAKTTVFRAVSHEMAEVTRIWCTGKSIGDSSDVTSLFEAARSLAPCVVFIEDMDLFGRSRDSLSGYESHILNEFLSCLDGVHQNSGVIIMASTNDIRSMDEALVDRPGRFDVKVEIPYPDEFDRGQMLYLFLSKLNAKPDSSVTMDTFKTVVGLTDGLTGAYVKELANSTVIRAVSRGNFVDGGKVLFSSDDLNSAAEQVVKNYRIGKSAKKKVQAEIEIG